MDEELSEEFVRAFRKEFKQEKKLTPDEVRTSLQSARAAVFNHAWSGAEMHARLVLKTEPMNPDALFYLGVSLAARGDEEAGEEYLTRALNHDPTNYDIYYNLGLIYMRRGEYEEAIALYTRGLFTSENNHAIHFQLAKAFEAAGKIEHAIKHYQKAVDTSPNPDGAWHYTGMDFTEEAREALRRLN
jgi:tetratricopeptide (TPR) repeat protein